MPLSISIIVPAHNAARTINDTIRSIRSQSLSDWQAIVVDDGSTDSTAEVITKECSSDSRFKLIHQEQRGEAGARNTGLQFAKSDWLLFLDADDWIDSRYLELMTNEVLVKSDLDAVHCGSARVASDGAILIEKNLPPVGDIFRTLASYPPFHVHSCIVKKALVDAVGGFDTSLVTCPDWDLWQRIARTGAVFGGIPQILAFYRMTPNSASLNATQMLKDSLQIMKRGHDVDPRVKYPHPQHKNGAPPEEINSQQYYLLAWCAGLMIGGGKDARSLLGLLSGQPFSELWPDSIAECLFESVPLSICLPPWRWMELMTNVEDNLMCFLTALEEKSLARDLATRTRDALQTMIDEVQNQRSKFTA